MSILNQAVEVLKDSVGKHCEKKSNIGQSERVLSVVAGGFIFASGVRKLLKSPFMAISGIVVGGSLVYRGVTGHCKLTDTIDKSNQANSTVIEHRYFVK